MVQELACSASYGINKTSISKHTNKRKLIADLLHVCQVLDTSPNILLTMKSKITETAKQPSTYERSREGKVERGASGPTE